MNEKWKQLELWPGGAENPTRKSARFLLVAEILGSPERALRLSDAIAAFGGYSEDSEKDLLETLYLVFAELKARRKLTGVVYSGEEKP